MRCGRSASRFGNAFSQGASLVTVRPHVKVRKRGWRAYDEGQRRYQLKALGNFGTLPGRERFADAKKAAEAFAILVESGGQPAERIDTVENACRRYLETHPDVVGRVTCGIFSDPIASVKLTKLRRSHLQAWRQRPQQKPALVTRRKKGPQVTRPRAPLSINRELAILRAALNKVPAPGTPGTDAAWQEALRAIRNADRQHTLYLDRDQRRLPLQKIDPEPEPFVRTLCLLPLRPGAVARLTAFYAQRPDLKALFAPLIAAMEAIEAQLRASNRLLNDRAKAGEVCARLMSVPGVGPMPPRPTPTSLDCQPLHLV